MVLEGKARRFRDAGWRWHRAIEREIREVQAKKQDYTDADPAR